MRIHHQMITLLLATFSLGYAGASATAEEDALTYGSVIKLQHVDSKYHLHSHQINWGSGSGQQAVTCHGGQDDQGSLWVIKEGNKGAFKEVGSPVPCGSIVRLQHLETGRNLHSHLFNSPLSNQQEVSCFGENGKGDTGDDFEVICMASGTKHWRRDQDMRLKHRDTGRFVHTSSKHKFTQKNCPNCPIIGQSEGSCVQTPTAESTWRATQGVFIHPRDEDDDAAKDEL